jgi:hypothetical protein
MHLVLSVVLTATNARIFRGVFERADAEPEQK